ncbi:delta endotoxin C-terminal domain-containing protein, partial [Bacillus cereus group sp. IBL03679]
NTYKVGLDKAVALKPNIKDYNKYPYLKGYTTSGSTTDFYIPVIHWNLMNDFRRDVTLMALDLVAIWPTYDIEKYTNPNGVNIQLSREVYSTAYGKVENKSQNWEVIERNFVRSPHLVTWLTNLAFYMSSNPGYFDLEQYAGIKSRLSLTGSNSTWEEGLSPVQAYSSIQNVTSNDIGGLRITTNEVTCAFDFKNPIGARIKAFGKCYESSFGGQYAYVHEASISPPSSSYPATHRLSYGNAMESKLASGTKGLKCVGLFGFGWLHNSLTPENTIVSDKTTQIPAVKGNAVDNGATVVRGPGSTGGDLVRLPAYNQQWTQLRVKVRPSATARTRGYKVRIRYASEGNANLFVGRYDDSYGWRENDNYPVERTFSGSMTYSAFTYLDTFNFSANEEEFKIELRCNSGGPIYIDKIEFIPEPEPPTPELPVTPGIYQIVTALNNSSVVDMDPSTKNVHLWQNGNAANQKWRFVYDSGQGAYQIKNIADENLVLTWQRSEGDNVRAVSNANRPEQYWIIQQSVVDTEYVFLQNKSNQTRVLDVSGSGTANGTNIGVYTNNGTTNKKFKLTRLS